MSQSSTALPSRHIFGPPFIKRFEPKTEYAKETVRTCKRRYSYGGMGDDKELMVTVAYLSCREEPQEPTLTDIPREEDVEPAKELLWYVWDMHTSIGKTAFYSMKKRFQDKGQGDYVASQLWFNCESAKCDKLAPQSFWWPLALRMWHVKRKKAGEEINRDWARYMPEIKALVEKSLHV